MGKWARRALSTLLAMLMVWGMGIQLVAQADTSEDEIILALTKPLGDYRNILAHAGISDVYRSTEYDREDALTSLNDFRYENSSYLVNDAFYLGDSTRSLYRSDPMAFADKISVLQAELDSIAATYTIYTGSKWRTLATDILSMSEADETECEDAVWSFLRVFSFLSGNSTLAMVDGKNYSDFQEILTTNFFEYYGSFFLEEVHNPLYRICLARTLFVEGKLGAFMANLTAQLNDITLEFLGRTYDSVALKAFYEATDVVLDKLSRLIYAVDIASYSEYCKADKTADDFRSAASELPLFAYSDASGREFYHIDDDNQQLFDIYLAGEFDNLINDTVQAGEALILEYLNEDGLELLDVYMLLVRMHDASSNAELNYLMFDNNPESDPFPEDDWNEFLVRREEIESELWGEIEDPDNLPLLEKYRIGLQVTAQIYLAAEEFLGISLPPELKAMVIEALSEEPHVHVLGDWEIKTPATCAAAGERVKNCADCGEVAETEPIPATGHSFGDWAITTPPTYSALGEETRSCSGCGAEDSKDIPKLTIDVPSKLSLSYKQSNTFSNGGNAKVKWYSDNVSVLTIDETTGEAKTVGRGQATITARVDGDPVGTCTVTVSYTFWQWLAVIFLFGWIWM